MSATVARLGRMIFGGWFVGALYLALGLIIGAVGVGDGGDLGALLLPLAAGLLLGALLSFGVGTRISSLRRAVRAEGRGTWGPGEISARLRALRVFWLVALALTAVVGLASLVTHGGTGRAMAGIGMVLGMLMQLQPGAMLWSASRGLTEFAREVAAEAGRGGPYGSYYPR
ncbi:hypothetical protein [Actinomadura violacea]|uniref:Uncharacterized protein n=1 Tax=Actinomadura violacea TaxID=2819934 RepID=A0ABS3RU23_9ACTN|nr:hypothetical protein [Actinomadura violacea]MBO2460228.1 hypothetical protein [Actinomadura violacea]